MGDESAKRPKEIHVGAPACFALELALRHVCEAFDAYSSCGGCFIVGSVLDRPDFRDVDVRLIMTDEQFAREFPGAGNRWEHDAKWLLLTVAISAWLSKESGLPVDFQFQPQTHANARHTGKRNAVGFRINAPEPARENA